MYCPISKVISNSGTKINDNWELINKMDRRERLIYSPIPERKNFLLIISLN